MNDVVQTFLWDPAPSQDIGEERSNVVPRLRSTEPHKQDGVKRLEWRHDVGSCHTAR
jgi:hypothetical protein